MAKEPANRFTSPAQFAAALVSALRVEPMPHSAALTSVAVLPFANMRDRKSTRLNSSHSQISYAVFCLKKKKILLNTRCLVISTNIPCTQHHVNNLDVQHTI